MNREKRTKANLSRSQRQESYPKVRRKYRIKIFLLFFMIMKSVFFRFLLWVYSELKNAAPTMLYCAYAEEQMFLHLTGTADLSR